MCNHPSFLIITCSVKKSSEWQIILHIISLSLSPPINK
jgi:hypothetical protein